MLTLAVEVEGHHCTGQLKKDKYRWLNYSYDVAQIQIWLIMILREEHHYRVTTINVTRKGRVGRAA